MTPQEPDLSRHSEANTNGNNHAVRSLPIRNGNRDGNNPATTGPYTVREAPLGSPRHLRILTIGAGASGLNLIRTLRNTLDSSTFDHIIYEKNPNVGGTWLENRYPGCRCDVPSHNYQFSWRMNAEWSSFFAPAEEIEQYLCNLCDEENMRPHIRTNHRVVGATWQEDSARWSVQVENLATGRILDDWAHFLIDATGILNKWKWPDVPNISDFEGELVHTAAWPKDFDYKDKTVAVIGNGASGVQVLPAIKPDVKKLYHIIRTPTAIIPPRVATMRMGPLGPIIDQIDLDSNDETFTSAQIARFKSDPTLCEQFAKALELDSDGKFAIALVKDSPQQLWAAAKVREFMIATLRGDDELCAKLIPDFPLGCRRLTPAPGYLEAFHDREKVELRSGSIKRFTKRGIEMEDGEILPVDAMVCATGFDNSFRPPYSLVGRKGDLRDLWAEQTPTSYMSLAVADVPNYFKFLGPNAPIAHGDVFTLSEHIATYVANLIRKAQIEGITVLQPSRAAVDDYAAHVAAFMPRTAFAGNCRSWYKQGKAGTETPVVGLHPGSRKHFIAMLENFRGEDWEFEYGGDPADQNQEGGTEAGAVKGRQQSRNRFAYLGNGFTVPEVEAMRKFDAT